MENQKLMRMFGQMRLLVFFVVNIFTAWLVSSLAFANIRKDNLSGSFMASQAGAVCDFGDRVLSALMKASPSIILSGKQPWYRATSEDHPE